MDAKDQIEGEGISGKLVEDEISPDNLLPEERALRAYKAKRDLDKLMAEDKLNALVIYTHRIKNNLYIEINLIS